MRPSLVFTDLDGTLLDHYSYSFEEAVPALSLLLRRGIPWVLNSSKTAAEMAALRQRLGNSYPYIVENGAAVIFPGASPGGLVESEWGRVKRLARRREEFLAPLAQWREAHSGAYIGFSDLNAPKLCELTGLSRKEAELALQREYSEPILWRGDGEQWQDFVRLLAGLGLRAQRGGRFVHISDHCDKGRAMQWLAPQLIPGECAPRIIALGDGGNDIAMLRLADEAVLIRSPSGELPDLGDMAGKLVLTEEVGPRAWNRAILALFGEDD